jgi:outer membrane protein assembly factor BamA
VLVLALGAPPQQNPSATGKLAAIKVTGSHRYRGADIAAASGLHVGDSVTREEIDAAANRLLQLGPFTSAYYQFTNSAEGLRLEFQLEDALAVPVSFDNFPWFTDAELTDAIKQAVTLFDGTAPEQGTILETMTQALQKLLAARGIHATVERTLMAQPASDQMMQQFRVEGASLRIQAVQFGDALASQSSRLRDRLFEIVGKPYSRFAVELFAHEQVRPLYLERGHLRARIGEPKVRFSGEPNRPLPDSVIVIVPIDPGPAYRWGGVTWSGNEVFNSVALDEFVALKRDEAANGVKIAGAYLHVRDEYGRRGYLDVKLDPKLLYDDAAQRASYAVTFTEGVQYRMGELVITGLSLTAERKLREAWRLPRGQIFDRVYFDEFLATGVKQAFADYVVNYNEVGHWLRTEPSTRTVDVLLDFK